ncbi:MAG: glycosyl transferase family 51 [Actinomycetota bacterium]|nr:MAG: glycosyl transferase family 51 [Actinomycetota bacterium]
MAVLPPSDMRRRRNPAGIAARLVLFVVVAVIAGLVAAGMALPLVGGAGVAARSAVDGFENLPSQLETPPLPQRTEILASDGSSLATVYYQNRVEVPLADVAPIMREAIVAVEDSRFLEHNGVDVRGTLRALVTNASAGGVQQGSSTLTMQYVRNVLINSADTPEEAAQATVQSAARKLQEMRYALAMEKRFSKAEILERYLNIAYFGAGAYGVEAAARRYFSISAKDLNLSQAATLAGLVQNPTAYDPTRNPGQSQIRRDVVLKVMLEQGYVTAPEAAAATAIPMASLMKPSTVSNGCTTSSAPFFCDYVIQTIRTDPAFGATQAEREALLRRGGLVIRTSIDPKAQAAADQAVRSYIPPKDKSKRATAIAMVQPGTGRIVAMAENRDWGTKGAGNTTYNYTADVAHGGTQGMQAGSTFKVFVLAAALEQGISPFEPIASPQVGTFSDFRSCDANTKFPTYTARNSTRSGTFDMRQGTAFSVNTYFLALEQRTGLCRPAEIAEQMGVTLGNGKPLNRVPSFTLGTNEVTPLAMAGAYAAFANHGVYCKPTPIMNITDRDGKKLDLPGPQCKRVVDRNVADSVTALLTGVVDGYIGGRTGQAMSLGRPAAGKTGTTNESAAVWFAGYTPDLATAVWVGDPRGGFRYPMKNVTINGRYYDQVFGSTLPGPIWKQAMLGALDGTPETRFDLESSWGLQAATDTPPPPPKVAPPTDPNTPTDPNAPTTPGATPGPTPGATPGQAPGATPGPAPAPSG